MKKLVLFLLASLNLAYAKLEFKDFDVAGIKLGMKKEEVVQAIAQSQGVKSSEITYAPYPMPNIITGKNEPKSVHYQSNQVEINVRLIPDPNKNGEMVAYFIEYKMENTEANKKALREATISKYGEPNAKNSHSIYYCADNKPCQDLMRQLPKLEQSHASLILVDWDYERRLEEWKTQTPTTKPKI